MIKIGILRETKDPPDRRVPFTPKQVKQMMNDHPGLEIIVQPSVMGLALPSASFAIAITICSGYLVFTASS